MKQKLKENYLSSIITIIISIVLLTLTIIYYKNNLNLYRFKKNDLILIYEKKLNKLNNYLLPNTSYQTKFTVFNNGSATKNNYQLSFKNLINTFNNNEYVYSLECVSYKNYGLKNQIEYDSCPNILENPIPKKDIIILKSNPIEAKITHEYTMKMKFIDTGLNQNYNQGKLIGFELIIE